MALDATGNPIPEPNPAPTPAPADSTPSETEPTQAQPTPVPDDHPTKLGRKVKQLEDTMYQVLDRFDSFLAMQDRPARLDITEDDPEVDKLVSKTEQRLLDKQRRAEEARQKYTSAYVRAVRSGFGEDEDLHQEVVKELLETNYADYPRHSDNPAKDAQINYELGIARVLRRQRKTAQARPNVQGDKPTAPTAVSSGSTNPAMPKPRIEPDEPSAKFLRAIGVNPDEEWVQESLKNAK